MEYPDDLRYSKDHEWIRVEGDGSTAVIGITAFAQSELGDIVYAEFNDIDESLPEGGQFGFVEAVKTTSDLYMPVAGTIIAHNEALGDNPELVNDAPYGDGWMIKIKMEDPGQLENLMSASDYADMVG